MTQTGPVVDIRDVQVIKDDRTFLVTDRQGNVPEGNSAALGLYHRDTRFLSGLELDVSGLAPVLLHSSTERNYSQIVELTYPFETIDVEGVHRKENVSVQRFRVLSGSLFERIRVRNFGTKVRAISLTVDFDADFLDVFEIRGLVRERSGQRQEPRVERSR
jgi:glycogen debranching enzyme